MADYLLIDRDASTMDHIKIEKFKHKITGETQRYRVMVGFYTDNTEIMFAITQDELDSLKRQLEDLA